MLSRRGPFSGLSGAWHLKFEALKGWVQADSSCWNNLARDTLRCETQNPNSKTSTPYTLNSPPPPLPTPNPYTLRVQAIGLSKDPANHFRTPKDKLQCRPLGTKKDPFGFRVYLAIEKDPPPLIRTLSREPAQYREAL